MGNSFSNHRLGNPTVTDGEGLDSFVEGVGPTMRAVATIIRELAQSDVPVLILAERGAGKHATAQRIHAISRRSGRRLHPLACATLRPEDLLDSTGGGQTWLNGGTVYLDELADLSLECQGRLLETLPVTDSRHRTPEDGVRLICGSARELEGEVKAGRLREDLYYRISAVCLRIPPLRQRKEDLPFLTDHFLQKYAQDFGRPVPSLSVETKRLFQEYAWPGNMHELEVAVKALVALGDENIAMGGLRAYLRKSGAEHNVARLSLKLAARAASREAEKDLILNALTRTRWNRRRAAEELQISYKALLYKLKQIGCSEYGTS
jgi:two-component system response regulator AtoC